MTFWLIFQNLVTHVTGCILHVDPSYNNRHGPSKNYNKLMLKMDKAQQKVKLHSVLI